MTKMIKSRINALEIENAELRRENISLRDQFAMAALTGILTRSATCFDKNGFQSLADYAYQIADAMLAARDDSTEN